MNPAAPSFDVLVHKDAGRVCSFYYGTWKCKTLPQAREWWRSREAEERKREAEERRVAQHMSRDRILVSAEHD